jgi:hypothetical protein
VGGQHGRRGSKTDREAAQGAILEKQRDPGLMGAEVDGVIAEVVKDVRASIRRRFCAGVFLC